MGGLGNQLFQLFAIIAYSFKSKNPFIFPYVKFNENNPDRPTYWETFLYSLKKYTNSHRLITNETLLQFEPMYLPHDYCEIQPTSENIMFYGYFQSYVYFKTEYSRIYELLDIDLLKTRVDIIDRGPSDSITISMHFRLGDYVSKQCYHPVLPIDYYDRSIQYIITNIPNALYSRIFVFHEPNDVEYVRNIISKLKETHPTLEFIIMEPDDDWKQMLLISKCDHHIIANSTFSWWGAMLSRNRIDEHSSDKIVCFPSIWYGHQLYYINVNTLFPKSWYKIDANSPYKPLCNCFSNK